MTTGKTLDWHTIARDYQYSAKSIGEMAKQHDCSRTAIQKRARKEGWVRGNKNAPATTTATKPPEIKIKRGRGRPQVWTDEAVDAVVDKFSIWLDADPDNLHMTQFAASAGLSSSQLAHLLDRSERFREGLQQFKPIISERFREGLQQFKPIIADRIARLGSQNKLNPTFSIFWLKQFGWSDRQDLRVELSSGAAIEAAINRAYGHDKTLNVLSDKEGN